MMAGHRNVMAIQGTNGFDEADIKTLNTHGVQAVTLLARRRRRRKESDRASKRKTVFFF